MSAKRRTDDSVTGPVMVASEMPPDADAVGRAVTLFLNRMNDDPLLGWAFEGVDAPSLQRHAQAFVIAALGGPDLYLGRGMREVHERFELRNEHFDRAVDHLLASLADVGISEDVTANLVARLEPLRAQIVSA